MAETGEALFLCFSVSVSLSLSLSLCFCVSVSLWKEDFEIYQNLVDKRKRGRQESKQKHHQNSKGKIIKPMRAQILPWHDLSIDRSDRSDRLRKKLSNKRNE